MSPRSAVDQLPSISVVVPSYNQGAFLREALESVFRQAYPRLEVVVMDGGSTDGSLEIIRACADRLTHWESKPDSGQAAAINEGVGRCSGEIVAWLNSDDYYWGDSLWTVARARRALSGRALYIGNGFRLRQSDGRLSPFCPRHVVLNREALVHGLDYLLQPAVFFSREAWEEARGLNPALRFCLDWDILIRISSRHPAVIINEFLAVSREHEATKTSRGRMERVEEIGRVARAHSGREMTPGNLYYVLETLVGAAEGAERSHLTAAMGPIREELARRWGNRDGFPERGDPLDDVYLPLADVGAPRRPRPADGLPAISVVTPSLNQGPFLGQALDSLLNQEYPRLEVLVFDGGSTDGSLKVLEGYRDRLTCCVSEPDEGPAHAINKGLSRATGEVVGWLNSDDMLTADSLWEVGRAFAEDPELDMVYGNALYVDERNRPYLADHGDHRTALYYGRLQPRDRIPAYWSYVHSVPQPTVFFRKRLLQSRGALDESYHFIFDFELFFRFAGAKVTKLERIQAFYRIHSAAKTSDWGRFRIELYRFSRPWWPRGGCRAFRSTLRGFLRGYARAHFGGAPRGLRECSLFALAGLSAITGFGNPERLAWRRPNPPAPGPPLAEAPAPARDYRIERREIRHRSLFCALHWPRHPGLSGGEIRDFHLLRQILRTSTVEFFVVHGVAPDTRVDWLAPLVEAVHTPQTIARIRPDLVPNRAGRRGWGDRLVRELRRRNVPVLGARHHWDAVEQVPNIRGFCRAALQEALARQRPDFLFVSPQTNPIALGLDVSTLPTRLILATYDVEAARIRSFADSERGVARAALWLEARRAARFERENVLRYDGVIAVSPDDKRTFVDAYGLSTERVLVIENSVDPEYFAFTERRRGGAPHVVFVGTLSYLANQQAAWRLIRGVMPLVRRRYPEACLWIVGQSPSPRLKAVADRSHTVVTGRVEDVRPYLAMASVACVPLTAGAGTKYKVLEALSAGVPVVCSPFAIAGLDLADGEHVLVGTSDEELAEGVVKLLDQPGLAAALARRGREVVEQRYTWDANLPRLDEWLALVASLPRRGQPSAP